MLLETTISLTSCAQRNPNKQHFQSQFNGIRKHNQEYHILHCVIWTIWNSLQVVWTQAGYDNFKHKRIQLDHQTCCNLRSSCNLMDTSIKLQQNLQLHHSHACSCNRDLSVDILWIYLCYCMSKQKMNDGANAFQKVSVLEKYATYSAQILNIESRSKLLQKAFTLCKVFFATQAWFNRYHLH